MRPTRSNAGSTITVCEVVARSAASHGGTGVTFRKGSLMKVTFFALLGRLVWKLAKRSASKRLRRQKWRR